MRTRLTMTTIPASLLGTAAASPAAAAVRNPDADFRCPILPNG